MKKVLPVFLGFAAALHAEDDFRIFAPSRSTESVLIIKAEVENDAIKLSHEKSVDVGFAAATVAAHPDKPIVYIATNRGDDVPAAALLLDEDGAFEKKIDFQTSHGYSYLSLDRESRFLLGSNYGDGYVDVYELGENGIPGKRVAALNEGRKNAHCVLPSPDNRFVYIPYVKDTNGLLQYAFDPKAGALTALDPHNANPPEGTGPRHMAYHPSQPVVYFSNEQHLGVSIYDKQENGQLKIREVVAIEEPDSKDGVSSSDILITPDGKFVYAGIRGHRQEFDWISRYRVQENGDLVFKGLTPADKIPWGLTLSPGGGFLLATAFKDGTLTAYRIQADGDLEPAAKLEIDPQISDLIAR